MLTEEALAAWQAPATGKRGGQPIYSALAIETSLALRLVFHLPLRQTEGLLRSIADVLKIDIAIPDHTTLSRRGGGLRILPKRIDRHEPLHLLVDSTGLKIYGEGEWLDQKHGIRSRRRWRKLHLGVDADTHEIVAVARTARMTAKPFTPLWPNVIPRPRSLSHPGPRPFRTRPRQRSATDILQRSHSMGASAGNAVLATIVGAWPKPQ